MHLQNTLELLPDSNPVAFERLLELTDQGQFEMIYPEAGENSSDLYDE